jgi:hypothetical protein
MVRRDASDGAVGLSILTIGLFKKLVIADSGRAVRRRR